MAPHNGKFVAYYRVNGQMKPQELKVSTIRITVPAMFWDDHSDRCPCDGDPELAMAREISRDKGYPSRRVTIEGTPAQIEVLRSDAAFYCDRDGPDECPPGLKRSAKATLAAIAKATGA